ncbi:RNA polymerase sigma factor [Agromyces sp. Leaf222]|uniref:RNA polymerase sigma factor n=1 Tax=Agromyces sp. Leaf222 TaxID=1735688 RepID=UPI0006FCEADB|nr:sigma-70 family RNA polymerase sigma factor [Agromyces sp. Leaf222]KQM82624.1 hypothetical protein ASE68_04495 [Agromyces sp. Leaf222]
MHAEATSDDAVRVLHTMFTEQPQRLRRRAVSLGLRREDAEDAAQAAAVAALEHIDAVRCAEEPVICAWVDTIARRVVADAYRRGQRERAFLSSGEVLAEASATGIVSGGLAASAETEWERQELVTATARAVQGLPEALREVVELRYGHGHATKRIAEELGLSDAAVRQRLSRARASLAVGMGDAPR